MAAGVPPCSRQSFENSAWAFGTTRATSPASQRGTPSVRNTTTSAARNHVRRLMASAAAGDLDDEDRGDGDDAHGDHELGLDAAGDGAQRGGAQRQAVWPRGDQ